MLGAEKQEMVDGVWPMVGVMASVDDGAVEGGVGGQEPCVHVAWLKSCLNQKSILAVRSRFCNTALGGLLHGITARITVSDSQ